MIEPNLMHLSAAERIIERFGFPIFLTLLAVFFVWRVWVYCSRQIEKKDDVFINYIQTRDAETNRTIACNTQAINDLRLALKNQTTRKRTTRREIHKQSINQTIGGNSQNESNT